MNLKGRIIEGAANVARLMDNVGALYDSMFRKFYVVIHCFNFKLRQHTAMLSLPYRQLLKPILGGFVLRPKTRLLECLVQVGDHTARKRFLEGS